MRNTILISLLLMLLPVSVSAQFYTITRDSEILPTERRKESYNRAAKDVTEGKKNKMMVKDTLIVGPDNQKKLENISRNSDRNASLKTELQKKTDDITKSENHLPELTIPNLYKEIIRNGILYPKIVLAQAILETGWFRSSVCRNKHNLFGLTNPRTGKYYEFNHWTESVRAYYTKVHTTEAELEKVSFEPGISVDINFVTTIAVKLAIDLLNRDNECYTQRLLPHLTQYTLVCNTNNTKVGGEMAEIFSYPLQVTTSIVVPYSTIKFCFMLKSFL